MTFVEAFESYLEKADVTEAKLVELRMFCVPLQRVPPSVCSLLSVGSGIADLVDNGGYVTDYFNVFAVKDELNKAQKLAGSR